MKSEDYDKLMTVGRSAYESIAGMIKAVNEAPDDDARDDATTAIYEDPLSLEVRSGWGQPEEYLYPEEFKLLLSTGGPATQIVGYFSVS